MAQTGIGGIGILFIAVSKTNLQCHMWALNGQRRVIGPQHCNRLFDSRSIARQKPSCPMRQIYLLCIVMHPRRYIRAVQDCYHGTE